MFRKALVGSISRTLLVLLGGWLGFSEGSELKEAIETLISPEVLGALVVVIAQVWSIVQKKRTSTDNNPPLSIDYSK